MSHKTDVDHSGRLPWYPILMWCSDILHSEIASPLTKFNCIVSALSVHCQCIASVFPASCQSIGRLLPGLATDWQ